MRLFVVLIAATITVGLVYLTFLQGISAVAGFEGSELPTVLPVLGLALIMAIGIFFGSMFRRMGNTDRRINVFDEAKAVLQSSSFVAALCVSPMVFFAAFATVRASPGDPASFLLAFQNGFFCESIFRRLFHADGTPPATATASASTRPRAQSRRGAQPASDDSMQHSAIRTTPASNAEDASKSQVKTQSAAPGSQDSASK